MCACVFSRCAARFMRPSYHGAKINRVALQLQLGAGQVPPGLVPVLTVTVLHTVRGGVCPNIPARVIRYQYCVPAELSGGSASQNMVPNRKRPRLSRCRFRALPWRRWPAAAPAVHTSTHDGTHMRIRCMYADFPVHWLIATHSFYHLTPLSQRTVSQPVCSLCTSSAPSATVPWWQEGSIQPITT